jgi:hypothetical protein
VGLLLALLLGGAAHAGRKAPAATTVYRVVSVTHSSSSSKNEPPLYTGSSTARWSLAPPTKDAPNTLSVTNAGRFTIGLGRVNVRGVYNATARSNRAGGRCSLSAPTGSRKYPAVAPGAFQLSLGVDPKSPNRLLFTQGPGLNVHATLGNPYFPSECATTISGEPSVDTLLTRSLPKGTFTQRTVVVRFGGATSKEHIAYRWSTVFTFRRVGTA